MRTPIDRFILGGSGSEGTQPAPPADRATLLRRVTLDLTGLPPTPDEYRAFADDRSQDAFATVVDRLLASERYGERWGRHWLDVARYADADGMSVAPEPFANAWRYRDWVIDGFNKDMPLRSVRQSADRRRPAGQARGTAIDARGSAIWRLVPGFTRWSSR